MLNRRDRYHSLRLRHGGLFQNITRNDVTSRGEHGSFEPVARSSSSLLREAGFTANTPDEVRKRRLSAIERERARRRHVHRRKTA